MIPTFYDTICSMSRDYRASWLTRIVRWSALLYQLFVFVAFCGECANPRRSFGNAPLV